ncbi:MAG: cyanophycinase, partial [Planctomycetota bacterium]
MSMPFRLSSVLLASFVTTALTPSAAAQGYIAAEGGGSVNAAWSQNVFGWMLAKAGGSGQVVILGVSGADNAAASQFLAAGASSATNLAVTQANADLQATYDAIRSADVVWMRGGNQANYVQWWNDTLTEQAIRDVYDAGGAIGGTSAGCAVLGELIYDSIAGSLSPKEALRDPFSPKLTFTDDFLELGRGILFDTHFTERGRVARLAVMLARAEADLGIDALGIGVDDRTAFCLSPDGTAEVIGEGSVTVLHRSSETVQVLQPGVAPIVTDLVHTSMTEGYRYDTNTRQVTARPANAAVPAPPTGTPSFEATLLQGSTAASAAAGEWQVVDGGDDAALFFGALQVLPGNGQLDGTVVSTRCWDSTAFDENRVGGPLYALALAPHALAVLLDGGTRVFARDDDRLS